ncbi:MAG TPA: trypsin-like peptidase domain-containing protein [Clostridia bacterium]|nr:trypsin-like peptidase domain-containing protein [Clostridia bacterium]
MKKFVCVLTVLVLILTLGLSACSYEDIAMYRLAVKDGYTGTFDEWIATQSQTQTEYTYEELYAIAVQNGYDGTFAEWRAAYSSNADSEIDSVEAATAKALRSVVCIFAGFTSSSGETGRSAGSGVIFYEDDDYAYIVTNYHVIYEVSAQPKISNDISVYLYGMFYDGFDIQAEYIGGSMTNDIAVIKIPKNDRYLGSASVPATIADSGTVFAGESAIAVGNPNAGGISVTSGIISIESENIDLTAPDELTLMSLRVFRIDTPVNPGNSGGGLFNGEGELIGIVNAKYLDSETDNIGYAIPTNIAISLARKIIESEGQTIEKVIFGITMQITDSTSVYDQATQRTYVLQEVTVVDVGVGSASQGYLIEGDILKSFTYNGVTRAINRLYSVTDYIFTFKQYDTVTFTILRNGVEMQIDIPMVNVVEVY